MATVVRAWWGGTSSGPLLSLQKMAGHDDCTERGEGEEDKAESDVDEAEERRADSVRHEANDEDLRGEPSHQPGGNQSGFPIRER